MKRRRLLAGFLCTILLICVALSACQTEPGNSEVPRYEIPNYQGQLAEGQEKSDFNQELFYRNDKKTDGPDPFVLDNTTRDGYYYLYGTVGANFCYRSKNLMDWEPVGNTLDNMHYENGKPSEFRRVTKEHVWAPEVVYDEDTNLYYMFFSATPDPDTTVQPGGKVAEGTPKYQLLAAASAYPDRGFQLVNFLDPKSCGAENVHSYDTERFPHYFAKYLMLNPEDYCAFVDEQGGTYTGGGYVGAIDPHPYVDDDGQKYLFWVENIGLNSICVVKMDTWLKPDWSTATKVSVAQFYTVEDWKASLNGEAVEKTSYENGYNLINEGPALVKHNGKYYLTLSVNSYGDSSYQVVQAVADNIMGPYRKLRESEGGLLISGQIAGSQEISGTGHHSFITVDGKMYIFYHRHNDPVVAGGARNPAVDEVKWITVKDINGNDLDVMYTNGPTQTVQPALEAFSKYHNIAPEATVTGSEDAAYLTDGLLSIYKYGNAEFMEYIRETTITEETTFSFDFDTARTVRAVMVYNSKDEFSVFMNIASIELVCEENGKEVIRYIENIPFSSEYYETNDYDGSIFYVQPGAAAYAEFDELNVKSVRITVQVPEGQESVGLSEIRILGK